MRSVSNCCEATIKRNSNTCTKCHEPCEVVTFYDNLTEGYETTEKIFIINKILFTLLCLIVVITNLTLLPNIHNVKYSIYDFVLIVNNGLVILGYYYYNSCYRLLKETICKCLTSINKNTKDSDVTNFIKIYISNRKDFQISIFNKMFWLTGVVVISTTILVLNVFVTLFINSVL